MKTTDVNTPSAPTAATPKLEHLQDPTEVILIPRLLLDAMVRTLNRIPNRTTGDQTYPTTYRLASAIGNFVRGTEQIAQHQVFGSTEDPETCPECGRRGVYFGEENEHYANGSSGGFQNFWCVGCGFHWLVEHD